jgi:hypothetical protein
MLDARGEFILPIFIGDWDFPKNIQNIRACTDGT